MWVESWYDWAARRQLRYNPLKVKPSTFDTPVPQVAQIEALIKTALLEGVITPQEQVELRRRYKQVQTKYAAQGIKMKDLP